VKIGFLLWDVQSISGGANAVIEHASGLRRRGHDVTLISLQPFPAQRPDWHPGLAELELSNLGSAVKHKFDFIFATWWTTYFELWRFESTTYAYFNQSLESRFYVERPPKLLNRLTYSLPLLFVTEARWLEQFIGWMQSDARVIRVTNGLNEQLFPCVATPPDRGPALRILLEGTRELAFKGVDDALELLQRFEAATDIEVGWLTTNSLGLKPSIGGRPVEIFERVPIHQVHAILRQFDVLLKLSRVEGVFGPPLEIFSQGGTAITSVVTGSEEFMMHGQNGLLVEHYNRGKVLRYLDRLFKDRAYLARLQAGAIATARAHPTWTESARKFSLALEKLHEQHHANSHLRPALESLSELRAHFLQAVEEAARVRASIGQGERVLLDRYRQLKGLPAVKRIQSWIPSNLKQFMRRYLQQFLQ